MLSCQLHIGSLPFLFQSFKASLERRKMRMQPLHKPPRPSVALAKVDSPSRRKGQPAKPDTLRADDASNRESPSGDKAGVRVRFLLRTGAFQLQRLSNGLEVSIRASCNPKGAYHAEGRNGEEAPSRVAPTGSRKMWASARSGGQASS